MSKIKNEAKIKNPLIVAIREQLEHRALWMYLLCDEAKKKGLDPLAEYLLSFPLEGNVEEEANKYVTVLDGKTPEEVAEEILELFSEY